MVKLPKDAEIGSIVEKEVKVKGNRRILTWKRIKSHGVNNNIGWKFKHNETPELNKARKEREKKEIKTLK